MSENLKNRLFFLIMALGLVINVFNYGDVQAQKVALLGTVSSFEELTEEEKDAYDWAAANFDASYLSFSRIKSDSGILNDYSAAWWHLNLVTVIPLTAKDPDVLNAVQQFVSEGKGLFLSGFATQYVVNLGVEDTRPQEIRRGPPKTSGDWGFYQLNTEHPTFLGLSNPFATISAGLTAEDNICWWTQPETFDGQWLADLEWQSNSIIACGEYSFGNGKILIVGAGAFQWYFAGGVNANRPNLEKFTRNILNYLIPPPRISVAMLGDEENFNKLTSEEQAAYEWAGSRYDTLYVNFDTIYQSPGILDTFNVVWWHFSEKTNLPASALKTDVITALQDFTNNGGGLLLSGLAPQYIVPLDLEETPPQVVSIDSLTSSASGFYQRERAHPIFEGFINPLITLSAGLDVSALTCWWDDVSSINGQWLADNVWQDSVVSCAEYVNGSGKIVLIGSPAFDWFTGSGDNTFRNNLEAFTEQVIDYLKEPLIFFENGLLMHWKFDETEGQTAYEEVSGSNFSVRNNFNKPEWVAGADEKALRLDGYSTWISGQVESKHLPVDAMTIEAWLALEAYPVSEAGIVNQHEEPNAGYKLGFNEWGQWFFGLSVNGTWYECLVTQPLPKNQWLNLAAVFDRQSGIQLYLNGQKVKSLVTPHFGIKHALTTDLVIGKDNASSYVGNFPTGVVNGIIDELKIYNYALSSAEIIEEYQSVHPPENPDLAVPFERFADDPYRPKYHAIPPANWTNEPHGLIYFNNEYHIFYQKNPNGPYWAQIHWGHMESKNLIHWIEQPMALAPQVGYDQRGIWSGCSMIDNDILKIMYTAVDGGQAHMALAQYNSESKMFTKYAGNPAITGKPLQENSQDFRDPFVWKESDKWYMIIGSGIDDLGGTVFLYKSSNLIDWNYLGQLFTGNKNTSGSFWEMPVFLNMGDKYVLIVNSVPEDGEKAHAYYWTGLWQDEQFTADDTTPTRLQLVDHFLSPTIAKDKLDRWVGIGITPDLRSSADMSAAGWAHHFSLPRIFSLSDENILLQQPLPELAELRADNMIYTNVDITNGGSSFTPNIQGNSLEIIAEIDPASASKVGILLLKSPDGQEETKLYYDLTTHQIVIDRSKSSLSTSVDKGVQAGAFELAEDEHLKLHIFIDRSVIEVFLNDGKASFSTRVYPTQSNSTLVDFFAEGGKAVLANAEAWKLNDSVTGIGLNDSEKDNGLPDELKLLPNFPNPFNPQTQIQFRMKNSRDVEIVIFDTLGRKVRNLFSGQLQEGTYTMIWDGSDNAGNLMTSGIYYCRLQADQDMRTMKMVLVK